MRAAWAAAVATLSSSRSNNALKRLPFSFTLQIFELLSSPPTLRRFLKLCTCKQRGSEGRAEERREPRGTGDREVVVRRVAEGGKSL